MRRFKSFLRRRIRIARDRVRLASVATRTCDAEVLRPLTSEDLRQWVDHSLPEKGWTAAAAELERLCAIEDGTGGINPGDRRALYYLIRGLAPDRVLEIGTHIGASTLYIAAALRDAGRLTSAAEPVLTTVDIEDVNDPETGRWKTLGLPMSPRDRVAAICGGHPVRFVTASSLEFLDRCRHSFDLIFLDGDHSASTVYREIPGALRVLRRNGLVLLHDYFPHNRPLWSNGKIEPGPFLATERLRAEVPSLAILPLGKLPWATKLDSRKTSLAVLTRSR